MANTQRQQDILDAALPLFAERGYDATTVRDIANKMNLRAPSLYNHFPSKYEMLTKLVFGAMEEMLISHRRTQANLHNPRERLVTAVKNHIRFHVNNKLAIQVTEQALKALNPSDRAQLVAQRKQYVQEWVDIIHDGIALGEFACTQPKIVTYALIDMGIGVASWYSPSGEVPLDQLQETYADVALRAVSRKTFGLSLDEGTSSV